MAITLNRLSMKPEEPMFYNQLFRRHLESYMSWFRKHPETDTLPVDPHDLYKYEGDLYGLFSEMGIDPEYHWLVARVNDLHRAGDVRETMTSLMVPDAGVVGRIKEMYKTQNKKSMT